ncbi:MAG: Na+/H+ antiporter subunit E [Thermotaleaceae bacterium]
MNRNPYYLKLFIVLCIFWLSLTHNLRPANIITGIIVVLIALYFFNIFSKENKITEIYRVNPIKMIYYFFYLLYGMFKASFSIIYRMSKEAPSPATIAVPTKLQKSTSIAILALSITLTPGTITVDYQEGILYVLCLYTTDTLEELIAEAKGKYEELLYDMEVGFLKEKKNKPMYE